ncbi:helix-turn-helix domain-containing protein [Streptomyces aureoverticillatus]|uniref:helix-turn-helix domain-containing protein n=1 Tax=Streptomyces aureoverticillatus TaxID=66871 RepID=UPI0013DD2EFF|nr:helix-turn-helix domain-containing protein [Streptomyces aureoverticillatus]QIB41828.1 helix-turn-helix domain-containing protein [Streptomyces aureoverticillatus]
MTDHGGPERPPAPGGREHPAAARQLGGALRALQQRSGRTLRSLEEQVRISDSSLSRYFRGDTVPPWPVVRDVCRALGGDPTEFRALWEAADRGRPEQPSSEPEVPSPAVPGRLARARARLTGRWAYATAGALAGLLAGVVVAVLALQSAPAGPNGSAASNGSSGQAPVAEGSVRADEASADVSKPPEATRIFVSRATGNCLDDSLDKGLRTYACNGMPYQWWTLNRSPDGARQLRNHATGKCLDHGGKGLRTVPCREGPSQRWEFVKGGDEAVGLRNAATGRCLADHERPGLRTLPCTATRHQKWA